MRSGISGAFRLMLEEKARKLSPGPQKASDHINGYRRTSRAFPQLLLPENSLLSFAVLALPFASRSPCLFATSQGETVNDMGHRAGGELFRSPEPAEQLSVGPSA